MIPVLYERNMKQFSTNGIGRLSDAISCIITEVRNGEYVLNMKYPITGKYYEEIKEERIIYAKPSDMGSYQPFIINKISKPIDGIVTIDAQHVSYLLNKMIVLPFEADTCQEALSLIPSNAVGGTNFTFWTDKHVTAKFKNNVPRGARGILGGENNSILDVYGKGEYEFDNFTVRLHVNRGQDRGVTLRYGKNIINLENTLDMSNVYTGIVPYWKSEDDIVLLPEGVLWSNYTGNYAYRLAKEVDFSGEWQDAPTVAQLRQRAQKYLTDNEGWVLPQNVTVSFVNLADTEEYKDIALMERVGLCDTVTITNTPLGVDVKAKVIKTIYDVLAERYVSIEIGEARPSLKTVIEEQVKEPIIQATSTRMQQAIKYATDLITGGKGGYLVINTREDGTPNELLLMNTPDKNTATQVLRINKNGIGFSNSYDGPMKTAWTLDGHFVADYIDTGTLNADLIRTGILRGYDNSRNYWNMKTGEFHLRSDGVNKGIDFANGVLSINADAIKTGTLDASLIRSGIIGPDGSPQNYWDMDNGEFHLRSRRSSEGIDFKDGVLSINADNITTGILSDKNKNTEFNLRTGNLKMGSGSIDIGGNFEVDSNGYLTCSGAEINGEIRSQSGSKWIEVKDGVICGGEGYSQRGFIDFSAAVDDYASGYTRHGVQIQGGTLRISTETIAAAQSSSIGTMAWNGGNGRLDFISSIRDKGDGGIEWTESWISFTNGIMTTQI